MRSPHDIWLIGFDGMHYRPGRVPAGARIEVAVDAYGNTATILHFGSIKAAVRALKSLEACEACVDCLRCYACSHCRSCLDCIALVDAYGCISMSVFGQNI